MAQPNLLEIVPDELFKTLYVADIDNVQKKLQYEIERKREDLRAMVGERYRDLIQAADTIEEMKQTTSSTLSHIGEMISACKNLHDTHLVGFKIQQKPIVGLNSQANQDPVHSMSVQIKLLMEIPEKIWTCIEAEDFVKATQLYIMARHVNTGIQLQVGGKNAKPGFRSLQRLVQQQWTSISNFNQTIIDLCKVKLQDVDITVEVACSCLISLYLLDSQSMPELLDTLIALTSNGSLKSALSFDLTKILEGDIKAQIKEKIVNAVRIVLKTVVLVYACFVDNEGGAVLAKLKDLYRKDSVPLIELTQFRDLAALKVLPPVIVNYRLTTNKEVQALDKEEITECVRKWSAWVNAYIDDNVKVLLQNVTRVKVLHEIREEAFKIETPSNWPIVCRALALPETHVWRQHFQPLVTRRVKEIIDSRWERLYEGFRTQMLVDLTKVSADSEVEKEADVNWFVWKDLIGDTVIETRGEVVKVMNSLMKGMWLQDRGCTPTLEKLCKGLDTELQRLLDDLKVYLRNDAKSLASKEKLLFAYDDEDHGDQVYVDKADVQDYLKGVCDQYVHSILQYIKACFEEPTLQSTDLQKKTTAIYTARFTQAIPNLMPHLHKCYITYESNTITATVDPESMKRWEAICKVLRENCLYCWGKWVDIALEKVEGFTTGLPQEFTLEANIDYLMMQWDVIKIDEKDDEGTTIETTIKVPAGPSLKLQEFLYSTSRILDEIVPHTLPVEIHTDFIEKVAAVALAHYRKVIREKETEINQRCALQLLMDVRHLTMLMVPRESKKAVESSQKICECIRQKIDPFDYDVFYPHIQTNLKRSVQRVQTLLGSLVLHHGQLAVIMGAKPAAGATSPAASSVTSPALLAGCAGDARQWFSLLPVAAPLARRNNIEQKKKSGNTASPGRQQRADPIADLMTSSLPINFATARSGAASFFNSMTSDWFSGS